MIIDRGETRWLVRLDEEAGLSSAAGLKDALVEALAAAAPVALDLGQSVEIDVTVLQLAFAAAREAERSGSSFVSTASEAARATGRLAGFQAFPGEPAPSGQNPAAEKVARPPAEG